MYFYKFRTGLLLLFSFSLIIWGCQPAQEEEVDGDDIIEEDITAAEPDDDNKKYVLPSPFELASLIRRSGALYSKEYLNSTNNSSKYSGNYSKALNLGVYGADLGYSLMYDMTQDGMAYLGVCKNLAIDLGIMGAFENKTVARVERNIENQDSIVKVVAQTFARADMYLKENERLVTSSLILAGGWIEVLYLAVQVAENTGSHEIVSRIGEQKISLQLLISQLRKFKEEESQVNELIDMLEKLSEMYNDVNITYDYKSSSIDTSQKLLVLNSTSTVEISEETLDNISGHITAMRNKIIE